MMLAMRRRFCISVFLSLLASMVSRASCKMDLSMCENLLKAHVDSLDQQQYMKVDLDERNLKDSLWLLMPWWTG